MTFRNRILALGAFVLAALFTSGAIPPAHQAVTLIRVPNAGIQPQVEVRDGVVHVVYFTGEPEHGDLFYIRSRHYGRTFSTPLRVNSPHSAIAVGAIRGAQLTIGRNGHVYVAWNGSSSGQTPMLYTRLNDAGTAFEPERNLITSSWGLNGGGAITADQQGNVYVFWHAPPAGQNPNEANRRVWMAKSSDDGKTFAPEVMPFDSATGVCGCCGMHAFTEADGTVRVLFRAAFQDVHRDMYLLTSHDHGRTFQSANVSQWNIGACVMSAEAFAATKTLTLAGWETEKQVYFGKINGNTVPQPIGAPDKGENRKYPALATNARGETLFAWTEGTAWKKGGSLAWQVYDPSLKPEGTSGKASDVPVWSFLAAFAKPDGSFVVLY